jgi:hypothetical protein
MSNSATATALARTTKMPRIQRMVQSRARINMG